MTTPARRLSCAIYLAGVFSAMVLGGAPAGMGQNFVRQFRAADAAPGDEFGRSVALDGGLGIIGAPSRSEAATGAGVAYLFDVNSGQELRKLVPDDSSEFQGFGHSVSVQGQWAIVGAPHDATFGSSSGAAYVFDVTTGQQLHKLIPSDVSAGDEFGFSVDLDDGVVIVGAHMDGPGSAYLFDAATGSQIRRLRALDAAPDDLFGVAVALDDGKALVGARYDDDLGIASGSAYIFDVTTGEQLHKLNAHDGVRGDRYGMHLDIGGNRAVIGARYDDDERKSSGSAYVYDVGTGEQLFKLVPDDTTRNDQFGSAISISRGLAVIGALDDDHNGVYAGSAYLFDINQGKQLFKFNAPDAAPFDRLGIAAALDNDNVLLGASMVNYLGVEGLPSGKAYVYHLPEPSARMLIGMSAAAVVTQVRCRRKRYLA